MLKRFISPKKQQQAGIWFLPDAIGLAICAPDKRGEQVLNVCELHPCERPDHRAAVLKKIAQRHQLDNMPCISLMPGNAYSLHILEAPEVPAEELAEAMRWRVKDLIDYPVTEAVIDVFDVPDQRNSNDMVYVVCTQKKHVQQQVDLLLDAGLNLQKITIAELAMRTVATRLDENGNGVALVHLGSESGSITLEKQGVLYFTRHLSGAEALFGKHYTDQITASIEGWLDTVIIDVQRSLDYYENQYQQAPTYTVVMVPLEKPIEGITQYFSSQLGVAVQYADLDRVIPMADVLNPDIVRQCLPLIGCLINDHQASHSAEKTEDVVEA